MSTAFLNIRSNEIGGGGTLVSKIFHMYSRYAESQGWRIESDPGASSAGPLNDVIAVIVGPKAFAKLRNESGVHRVQWVPLEEQGQVLTTEIWVAVASERDGLTDTDACTERSETIRTYNFPLNRLTDHRIGLIFKLDLILDGKLGVIIDAVEGHGGGR